MAIERTANAVWHGDLRSGDGQISTSSGVLQNTDYSFAKRWEQEPGTNPEELIAAAHAACFNMAFAATLSRKGYQPQEIRTTATCVLSPQQPSGWKITQMRLESQVKVDGLDDASFQQIAKEGEAGCPVSNLLRGGAEIQLHATLM